MDRILAEILKPKEFSAFIDERMKLSTYAPAWEREMDTDYSASKSFNEYVGEYSAAFAASVIEKNASKPLQNMPNLGQITGVLGRYGDLFQMDNDRLDHVLYLEDRYRNRAGNMTSEQKKTEFNKVLKYLFEPFERAAVAPHKRIDQLYYGGLSTGKLTVTLTNNPNGVQWDLDLGVPTVNLASTSVIWSTTGTSKPIQDITARVLAMRAAGKNVVKIQMNNTTFQKMASSTSFNGIFSIEIGKTRVSPSGIVTKDMVNQYLEAAGMPPIEIVDVFILQSNGTAVNAFADDRVVFRTEAAAAKLIIADPLESKDPHPNKVYSTWKDNLISQYRTENGRFVEYEMWALPVFTGRTDMTIMKVDTKD